MPFKTRTRHCILLLQSSASSGIESVSEHAAGNYVFIIEPKRFR